MRPLKRLRTGISREAADEAIAACKGPLRPFCGAAMEAGMQSARLNRFRKVAFWEGVSYVVLLGLAMPLKYLAGIPEPVKVVGWAHGVLFILYVILLADAMRHCDWSVKRGALFFVASLLPFAPFFVEKSVREEQLTAA